MYPGELLHISNFPNLKRIVQTGHNQIRGTLKYKDTMSYVKPSMSLHELPENSPNDTVLEIYQGGRVAHSFSNQDICNHAEQLWSDNFKEAKYDNPVFMSC